MSYTILDSSGVAHTIPTRLIGGVDYPIADVVPGSPTVTGAPITITVGSVASGKSGGGAFTLPAGTTHVLITVVNADIQVTEDGATTPTVTVGNRLPAGTVIELANATNLNFIRVATDAILQMSPRKYS